MKIENFIQEIKYRTFHTIVILTIQIVILYSKIENIINYIIVEINEIETSYNNINIISDLTDIIIIKITLTALVYIFFALIVIYIEKFLFNMNGLTHSEIYVKLKTISGYTLFIIPIISALNYRIMPKINKELLESVFYYKDINLIALLNLKEFIKNYISIILILIALSLTVLIYFYKKNYIKRNKFFLSLILITLTALPPELYLHLTSILIIFILTEIIKVVQNIRTKIKNWKRLDSNQRSKIQ